MTEENKRPLPYRVNSLTLHLEAGTLSELPRPDKDPEPGVQKSWEEVLEETERSEKKKPTT